MNDEAPNNRNLDLAKQQFDSFVTQSGSMMASWGDTIDGFGGNLPLWTSPEKIEKLPASWEAIVEMRSFFAPKKRQKRALKKYIVYGVQNTITGKWYVGITQQSFGRRKSEHLRLLRKGNHHSAKLQNAFNKYGEEIWDWQIRDTRMMTPQKAGEVERQWIRLHNSFYDGYNMDEGYYLVPINRNPNPIRKVTNYGGLEYKSLTDAAKANGLSPSGMLYRIKKGYDNGNKHFKSSIIWEGVRYASMKDAVKATGVGREALTKRLKMGYTCEADMKVAPTSIRKRAIIWEGVEYSSIYKAAKASGHPSGTLHEWVNKGYSCFSDVLEAKGLKADTVEGE
jgi:group I intron endonuclease